MIGKAWVRGRSKFASAVAVLSLVVVTAPALGAEYEQPYEAKEAAHPVKIIYYITYPVGFVLDTLILKPAYWLGRHEPFRTVFGTDVDAD